MNVQLKPRAVTAMLTSKMSVQQAILSLDDGEGIRDIMMVYYDNEGGLCMMSSAMNRADALYMMEAAKHWVLDGEPDC